MFKKGLLITAITMMAITPSFAKAYKIDKAHSSVGFNVRHLGLSKTHGHFDKYSINVDWDDETPNNTKISATVAVKSIDTGIKRRDNHLKSADFFDAKQYPNITFESTAMRKVSDSEYVLYGNLTLKETTKKVRIPLELIGRNEMKGKERIGLEGQFKINRFDYGVEWKNKLKNGTLIVSDTVTISLDIQLIEK